MKITPIAFNLIDVIENRNPRMDFGDIEELANSIRENGLRKPIEVQETSSGTYLLVDGERRYKALSLLKTQGAVLKDIPAIIRQEDLCEEEVLVSILLSNDGKPFLPIEEAEAYKKLQAEELSVADISRRLGRSLSYINDRLALIGASENIKKVLADQKLPTTLVTDIVKKSKNNPELEKELLEEAAGGKEGKAEVKRKLYGFRLPEGHKGYAHTLVQVMHNLHLEQEDLEVEEEERGSRLYLAGALEALAIINKGSLADLLLCMKQ